jgi:hypothetical protein
MRSSPLFTGSRTEHTWSPQFSSLKYLGTDHVSLLLREIIYRAIAQKRPRYIRPSRGRYISTALHAVVYIPSHVTIRDRRVSR